MYKMTKEGIVLSVKIIPKSSRNAIVGWEGEELKIRISAVPEKGEANAELISYLSEFLGIAKSKIEIISGQTSRHKRLIIKEINNEVISKLD